MEKRDRKKERIASTNKKVSIEAKLVAAQYGVRFPAR
jgi:hypothetical protein